jgi:hypothetical protein
VPVTRSGREERSTRTVRWWAPAATDISIFPMIRQSIDPQSCSTTPLRDSHVAPGPPSFPSDRPLVPNPPPSSIACAKSPARSANSRYQPASSRSLRGSSMGSPGRKSDAKKRSVQGSAGGLAADPSKCVVCSGLAGACRVPLPAV